MTTTQPRPRGVMPPRLSTRRLDLRLLGPEHLSEAFPPLGMPRRDAGDDEQAGRRLYASEATTAVVEAVHDAGHPRVWATIRASNEASQRIVRGLGFLHTSTRPDADALLWFRHGPEDAPAGG